ncbi:MAG TPA: SDR family NAD(P)-dependent oxidoreductase, partial [Aquella sp.]|nr:SDR family NAD(P)-dependent oxidoreductase [Aquella sp.]
MSKTIIVTCATGNIGKSLCEHLASKHYNLILISKTQEKLEQFKQILTKKYTIRVDIVSVNFDYKSDFGLLHQICKQAEFIDGVVLITPKITPTNNCFPECDIWIENFNRVFVNPLELLKNLMPYLQSNNKRSKIAIISGISSVHALPNYVINNTIRTAWLGHAKSLAIHYGDKGIHFNTLSIGGVMTETFFETIKKEALKLNRSPEEILSLKVDNVPLKKYAS